MRHRRARPAAVAPGPVAIPSASVRIVGASAVAVAIAARLARGGVTTLTSPLLTHPLVAQLVALGLPPDDYVVFGSGPLLAHGLTADVHDLDIVARGRAWQLAAALKPPVPAPSGTGLMVELAGGELQVFNAWTSPGWDVNELIDEADVIDGIRFVTLPVVLAWKRESRRDKDTEHVELIEKHLAE